MQEYIEALVKRHLPGHYKPTGDGNIQTKCPFHKGGEERKPSFSINLVNGLFHCFTCHIAGDVRRLLRLLGLPRNLIDAETKVISGLLEQNKQNAKLERENLFKTTDPFATKSPLPEALLGVYEWCPAQLVEQGFDVNLLQQMEIGFDQRNMRVTYPIRDLYGTLAGVSGGATSKEQQPKYKVYQGRRQGRDGQWIPGDFGPWFDEEHPSFRCENHLYLWNFNQVYPRLVDASGADDILFIVEGFKACLWMIQNGFINTVALMGSSMSSRQQALISQLGSEIVLCLDNDAAGRSGSLKIGHALWEMKYNVRVMKYPDVDRDEATQPDDYEPDYLQTIVAQSKPYLEYANEMIRR